MMVDDRLEIVALGLWRAREAKFPSFARRMRPDELDRASGAWERCLEDARTAILVADGMPLGVLSVIAGDVILGPEV